MFTFSKSVVIFYGHANHVKIHYACQYFGILKLNQNRIEI